MRKRVDWNRVAGRLLRGLKVAGDLAIDIMGVVGVWLIWWGLNDVRPWLAKVVVGIILVVFCVWLQRPVKRGGKDAT